MTIVIIFYWTSSYALVTIMITIKYIMVVLSTLTNRSINRWIVRHFKINRDLNGHYFGIVTSNNTFPVSVERLSLVRRKNFLIPSFNRGIRNRRAVARDCDALTCSDVQNDGNLGSRGHPVDHGTD